MEPVPASPSAPNGLVDRMLRASKLDVQLYEEVEADTAATTQAAIVVVLASVAAGIGGLSSGGFTGLVVGTIGSLIYWCLWAGTTYLIGTRLLPEPQTKADAGELLRTIGFSSAPGVIRILGIIPGLTAIVFFVAQVWMLVAMVIAVRQALDYTGNLRAIGVCIIGWVAWALIFTLAALLFGSS